MPFFINRNFENQLYEYLSSIQAWVNSRPVDLGGATGPSGGYGAPWKFIGQLAQSKVAFDTSEASTWNLPTSGWSLVHNLNRIRHRITDLEIIASGGNPFSGIEVQRDDIIIGSGITVLNFEGAISVIQNASNKVTISVSGTYQPAREIIFTLPDELETTVSGGLRMYNQLGVNLHANKVFLAVSTPSVSGGITVDIHKNGTTIFTTQANRPTITQDAYTGYTTTIEVPDWNDGDYYTMDLDTVGSGASFLTVAIKLIDTSL